MQPGHSLIDPPRTDHAVLSQRAQEHGHHFGQTDRPALQQAGHHPQIREHRPGPSRRQFGHRRRRRRRASRGFAALGVERPLLLLARLIPVVGRTASVGLTPAMGLATAKGAAQIVTPRVAWVGEKENPAVPTAGQAPAQRRLGAQHRSQHRVIREHQGDHRPAVIPIGDEPKMRRDLDCQKPRFWLWTPTSFKHPLSYGNSLRLSRWGKGIFLPARPMHGGGGGLDARGAVGAARGGRELRFRPWVIARRGSRTRFAFGSRVDHHLLVASR